MLRYSGLKINIEHSEEDIKRALSKKLRLHYANIINFRIIKKSLDARDKNNIHWNYIIDFTTDRDKDVLKKNKGRKELSVPQQNIYRLPFPGRIPYYEAEHGRICVVGSGPAGLFAAYFLAENGFRPILIERGENVEDRLKTVEEFISGIKPLNVNSNVQFGEGGAGTFSDGKLNTGVNDPSGRNRLVLETFVKHGAPENILYDSKPHIGSDRLAKIVASMRQRIIENGGEVLFNTLFTGFDHKNGCLCSITVKKIKTKAEETCDYSGSPVAEAEGISGQEKKIPCTNLILAPGHSARDTFKYLIDQTPIEIESKPFAVGVRVQHPQELINEAQYGKGYKEKYNKLPAADYKLVRHTADGKNVYSFCMCPGGYVINSSSEEGRLCINGMSYSGRSGENANSAIVVNVSPSDDPSENIRFQTELEEKAFKAADGKIPVQLFKDFESGKCSNAFGTVEPGFKGAYAFADINEVLGEKISGIIKESLHDFSGKINGFVDPDTLISAVESRTSSPVRIKRGDDFEANIAGIYPCGEGAGYAGGITSAAIDGIKVFEAVFSKYSVNNDMLKP